MTTITADPSSALRSKRQSKLTPVGLFYSVTALLLIGLALAGFRHFFFEGKSYPGREITPPIRTLVITHGIVMSAWLAMFLIQPLLIAVRKPRLHMSLGWLAAAIAVAVVVTGAIIGVQSARVTPPEALVWGLPMKQFMAVPLAAALVFAVFIGLGIWFRKKPAIHRPMMLLGTFTGMSAAISRIDVLNNLYVGTVWERLFGPFLWTQLLCGVLLVLWCVFTGKLDRWFTAGFIALTLICFGVWQMASTAAWTSIAHSIAG